MSWLKDLWKVVQGEATGGSPKLVYGRVEAVTGWAGYDPQPVPPGTAYMQWWLQEMWLQNEREWLNHYAPVVYSVVKLRFGHEEIEIPSSIGDFDFAGVAGLTNLQDALRLNYPMTPPLPYNGGNVEVSAALIGVQNANGFDKIISAMDRLGKVLAVPQLSAVVAVAGPVADTLDSVLGQGEQRLELGVHQTFKHGSEEELRAGYYVAAWYDGSRAVLDHLTVVEGRLCWQGESPRPVREFDYLLFRLEMMAERDDLADLSSIFDSMAKAKEAATAGRIAEAKAWVQKAGLTAFDSLDLTVADRRRLPPALRIEFEEFLTINGIVGDGASVDDEPSPLAEIIARTAPETAIAESDAEVLDEILRP